ncbi:MAG TPA: DNA translocase FtsK [Candidatus Limnocylindrales bacterium]|nr:DNA translocase FtsK [Candidatus Limnocylindrales bacterium]
MSVRLLTPTENHRLNELVGFLGLTMGLLVALSLLSYNPHDASLNVSALDSGSHAASNWIGPVGAHGADLLFQGFGYAAFLLPAGILVLGTRWIRSRTVESPVAKVVGWGLLGLGLPALVSLWGFPNVRGAAPPGGLLGDLLAAGLTAAFNSIGAQLVTVAALLAALFLTTKFTFLGAESWAKGPLSKIKFLAQARERWAEWREQREQERLRKRVEEIKISGRPAVASQVPVSKELLNKDAADEEADDAAEEEEEKPSRRAPVILRFRGKDGDPEEEDAPAKVSSSSKPGPKIASGPSAFKLPSTALLRAGERSEKLQEEELKYCARAIEEKYREFDVGGHITQINPGPVVTTYEFKPEAGIKYSRITGLSDDLCLALRAESILIDRIPGKSTVGVEVPNHHRQTIALRDEIESPEFVNSASKLTLAMGKDLIGRHRVSDLALMPHLLIAGATGTGKSVFLNALIVSMLYKATPDELKLVMVDPKRLELGLYEGIPHLLAPVVTDPKVASNVLRNATREMEKRLKMLAQRGVRNIDQYNRTFKRSESLSLFDDAEEIEHKPLPYIVIVIDELADLMMVDTSNVEAAITRLAQMARAVGIHLILATQRPSVDVITGLIKANFPARISFRVASKVDSRTILDANGSESLLGRGDMLYLPAGSSRLHRIHGPLVSEEEITAVCEFWRGQAKAVYNEQLLEPPKEDASAEEEGEGGEDSVDDELYQEAVRVVCEMGRASTSTLQRRLRIGYGRAARLIDIMEKDGIVGPPDGTKPRELLKKKDWMREFDASMK